MKFFWKKLLSFALMMGLLMTSIPSAGALVGEKAAPVGQTSSTDWKKLLAHSKPTLPEEGTYAPNRLLVTRVDSGVRAMSLDHESIIGTDTLFSLDMPRQAQEVMQMDTEETEKITCTAVSLLEGSDMLAVMTALSKEPGVLAVEVDSICTLDSVAEGELNEEPEPFAPAQDPLVAQQTWLESMGATKAWDMVTAQNKVPGAGVVVAVLDTGITADHPDLKGQIVPGGRHFWLDTSVTPSEMKSDGDVVDAQGHGTHVSGMIAGAKNGTGITGVAYGAKILPIKILGDDGSGYHSAITRGMLYAAGLVDEVGNMADDMVPRCDIANMSLGSNSGSPSLAYEVAVAIMREAGIFLVAAAGNEETGTCYVNPANIYAPYVKPAYVPGAFSVMAMQETPLENGDYLTTFSNWDSDPYVGAEYTIMAPGSKILSSVNEAGGWYARYSGTSMASPATAGAAALVLGANPSYTAEDLWSVLATSGQKRQGKTDQGGKKYDYHTLDVVAALNTKPASVKSVVKGTVAGNWTEVPNLKYISDFALVIPKDSSKMPKIKLTLRSYDGEAYNLSATGEGLEPTKDRARYLAPGSEAEFVFTLEQMPTTNIFETTIAVTWTNRDGSAGSETVPVSMEVVKAAPGARLMDPTFGRDFYDEQKIELLWIFEDAVSITLPTKPATGGASAAEPEHFPLSGGIYYFGETGSMTVTKSADFGNLLLWGAYLFNPQISGDVHMMQVNMETLYERAGGSTIDMTGGMFGCTIDGYNRLNLTVSELIDSTTIANSAGSTITTGTMRNSTLINNFSFGPSENGITEFTVTEPTHVGASGSTGFYDNAVIGPAKVSYKEGGKAAVPATAKNCYYLPTANMGDNEYDIGVPAGSNELACAGDSTVYVEGVNKEPRPEFLEDCHTFLISTKRVPNSAAVIRDSHLSYRLESEFSNASKKGRLFGYFSYLSSDGNFEAENIVWAEDGLSCTYTVYTRGNNRDEYDMYVLEYLGMPLQYDVRNFIHDRTSEEINIDDVTAERVKNELGVEEFVVSWDTTSAGYGKLKVGKLFCQILSDKDDVVLEYELKPGELTAGRAATPYTAENKLPEGTQYKIWAALQDKAENPGYKAEGTALYYEPYKISGEEIDLESDKIDANDTLNLSGRETATLTLRATKSFNMNEGLKITVNADKDALEITSVVPGIGVFSGIARDGNQTVIELAPAEVTKEIKYRDQFVFEGDPIATLTIGGKNVASDGMATLHVQDFFGKELLGENGQPTTFFFDTKTTAVSSGGGDYTPPKDDTQTLPDGTLVTTTTNPDGSIQIVYKRSDGVSSTVKTPVKKGEASTASISLPPALAGKNVKVPIPVAAGGVNTVAVLVGADGKEQVIPGSFWKNGVLTVPLTENATILIRDNAKTFGDVAADHWAADAIAFVTSRELFRGDDKGFRPADDTTRSMLVTVLARLDGQNTAAGVRWDSVGTAWAKERGISDGSDMEDAITREQLAVMLYRYAKAEQGKGDLTGFSDADGVSPWARDAMGWAVKTGILGGMNGALNPQGNASRAEVAAMLARFVANV